MLLVVLLIVLERVGLRWAVSAAVELVVVLWKSVLCAGRWRGCGRVVLVAVVVWLGVLYQWWWFVV